MNTTTPGLEKRGNGRPGPEVVLGPAVAGVLAQALRQLRRRLAKRWRKVRSEPTVTRVHELRVEIRRLLAMVRLLRGVGMADGTQRTQKLLKRQLDVFDELRDLHICQQQLAHRARGGADWKPLEDLWSRREADCARRIADELRPRWHKRVDARLKRLQKRLKRAAGDLALAPTPATIAAILRPLYERVVKRARPLSTVEAVHRLRVAFKPYRYGCEILRPLLRGLTARTIAQMRAFHLQMGELQDLTVFRNALKRDRAKAGVIAATWKRMDKRLRQRQLRCLAQCRSGALRLADWEPSKLAQGRLR
ncbi:MAG: CHAD domain-containing protein [Verrucomicrobiota bacterium]|nr:CHAD domain-containing protein [Limisphaera sp.]MDW8381027.1 CHAD domain-containing protein [Verrucomicrobiota bacterium]